MKKIKTVGIAIITFIIGVMVGSCGNSEIENQPTTTQQTTAQQEVQTTTVKEEEVTQEVYNENGVKIIYKNTVKDEYGDINVNLRIENNTEGKIIIQARDTSVDGIMLDPVISDEIMPGKTINTDLGFMSYKLEENAIDSFSKLETKLLVMDENWDDLFEIPIELDVEVQQ